MQCIISINKRVYWRDHDENLDGETGQQDMQVYEHIDKPLVLESSPRKAKNFISNEISRLLTGQL